MWRYVDAARRRTVQEAKGHVGRVASKSVNGHQRSTDHPRAEENAERSKQRSIRRGAKGGQHSLVRVRPTLRVCAEGEIKDGRVAWKGRAATQDFRKGQLVGPDKRQPFVKALELVLELSTPELSQLSGPHHHEHLLGLGKQLQDVIDEPGKIVVDCDGGLVLAKRRVAQISLIDRCEQERCVGKEFLSILAREDRRRAADSHDELRLGAIDEDGSDVVDNRLFGRGRQTRLDRRRLEQRSQVGLRAGQALRGNCR